MNKKEKFKQLREKSNRQLRRFSEPLKRQIVNDIEMKVTTIAEVSREYTVTRNAIYKWIYSYSKNRKKGVRTVIEENSVSTKLEMLKSKIKELESVIGQKQMKIDFQEKMIDLAEKEYCVDIKKNFGSKRFSGIGKNEPD
ncbi:transposase [Leptospira santarosai]|nr:transposase [Leptospira santarosai]